MKFTTRVILLVLGSIFVSVTLIAFLIYHDIRKGMGNEFQKNFLSISDRLSQEISYPLFIGNQKEAIRIIKQYIKLTSLQGIILKNPSGKVIDQMGKIKGLELTKEIFFKEEKSNPYLLGETNGTYNVKHLGTIELFFSTKEIKKIEKNILEKTILLTTILLLILGAFSYIIATSLLQPITHLISSMEISKEKGEPSKILFTSRRKDEIGELIQSYNDMVNALIDAREKLEESYRELSRKDKLAYLGKIVTTVAHELKNPLGIIRSSAQLLQKDPENKELIQFIIEETERLDNVIKEFLQFANTREPSLELINLKELIQRAIIIWETTHNEDVTIYTECENIQIYLDKNLFTHAITNLLTNAVEAKQPNKRLEIIIRCKESNYGVKLEVEDNGVGIDEKYIDNIFEPFFTTKEKGTGMGLAITYDIIKKHGGEIKVHTLRGTGTTFIITLPGTVK